MSAHTVPASVKASIVSQGSKRVILALQLSASYDAGGSVVDLSTSGSLGQALGFTRVFAGGMAGQGTAADSKYFPVFIPAASDAPATGKVKVHDTSAAADAEASGDLHLSSILMWFEGV